MTKKHITNKISNIFDKIANKKFIKPIQRAINNGYVNILGLDMSEFNHPNTYETLNALFTRELKTKREIEDDKNSFISPADSFVTEAGFLQKTTALQIKGMSYDIGKLLTTNICDKNIEKLVDGAFMNMYLSPKDYHRYHSAFDFTISKLIHIPGKLYPVNLKYLNKQKDLFIENERVVLECTTNKNKLFYMVFVGALNVGKMVFNFEPRVETNTSTNDIQVYEYDNLAINKADCLGYFKMGSTVLMFWQKDMVELEDLVENKIKFGQKIASLSTK